MAFLSVRVPEEVRNRVKAIAAARGEKLQDLVGGLIARFLEEADRRPPQLANVLRSLREREADLRNKGVAALWIFGSVARGDARPDSDIDRNRCGGITYKFCVRVEMMSSVAD